jgi:hypothetical protein
LLQLGRQIGADRVTLRQDALDVVVRLRVLRLPREDGDLRARNVGADFGDRGRQDRLVAGIETAVRSADSDDGRRRGVERNGCQAIRLPTRQPAKRVNEGPCGVASLLRRLV